MIVVLYTGDPGDPQSQYMRAVEAPDLESARAENPDAFAVLAYEHLRESDEKPSVARLMRGMPVWKG